MLDVRLAAQGKPAVAAFFREHGFSSDYFPRMASRSSRIRRRKKYHNQGKQHISEIRAARIHSNALVTYNYAMTSNYAMAFAAHSSERTREAQDVRLVIGAIPTLVWSARPDGSAPYTL